MVWAKEQRAAIFNIVWQGGQAECPDDGAVLRMTLSKHAAGYDILVDCPRCGTSVRRDRSEDPKAGSFRPWTDAEKAALVEALGRQGLVVCPVDGTGIDATGPAGPSVLIRCWRCGNDLQHGP